MEKFKYFVIVPILHVFVLYGLLNNPWLVLPGFLFYILIHTLGQNIGYHKLFSHNAFEPTPWYPYVAAFFGSISFVGDPVTWSLVHRMHHAYADTKLDPHSPATGRFHAYIGWVKDFDPSIRHYKLVVSIVKKYPWMESYTKWEPIVPIIFYSSVYLLSPNLFYAVLLGGLLSLHSGLFVNAFLHNDTAIDNKFLAKYFHTICFHKDHHLNPSKFDYSQNGVTDLSKFVIKFLTKKIDN